MSDDKRIEALSNLKPFLEHLEGEEGRLEGMLVSQEEPVGDAGGGSDGFDWDAENDADDWFGSSSEGEEDDDEPAYLSDDDESVPFGQASDFETAPVEPENEDLPEAVEEDLEEDLVVQAEASGDDPTDEPKPAEKPAKKKTKRAGRKPRSADNLWKTG